MQRRRKVIHTGGQRNNFIPAKRIKWDESDRSSRRSLILGLTSFILGQGAQYLHIIQHSCCLPCRDLSLVAETHCLVCYGILLVFVRLAQYVCIVPHALQNIGRLGAGQGGPAPPMRTAISAVISIKRKRKRKWKKRRE